MGTPIQRPYKVRTSWEDSKTQLGSYAYIDSAIKACTKVFRGYEGVDVVKTYKVFKDGICVYNPEDDEELDLPMFPNTFGGIATNTSDSENAPDTSDVIEKLSIWQRIKNRFRRNK